MGIYIDMEMPTGNNELWLIIHSNGQVIIDKKTYWEETEAVLVPPHGRLIDADALYTELAKRKSYGELSAKSALRAVANAPTIIQASGKDTDVPTREECE